MKPNILVIGSTIVDLIINVPRIPKPGETIIGNNFFKVQGGKVPIRLWPPRVLVEKLYWWGV